MGELYGQERMGEDRAKASRIHSIYDIGEEQNLLIKNLNTSSI